MTDARSRVLAAVTQALGDPAKRISRLPPVFDLGDAVPDAQMLAERFSTELAALAGTCTLAADRNACATAVSDHLRREAVRSVAIQSRPLAQDIGSRLAGFDLINAVSTDKTTMERVDCALLEAQSLFADTGSAIVVLDNGGDRVLPYLPRTCIIVAGVSALHTTMSLRAIAPIQDAADRKTRGEALIIAGPSRTADIEKTIVLGAHGPARVDVFIIEDE